MWVLLDPRLPDIVSSKRLLHRQFADCFRINTNLDATHFRFGSNSIVFFLKNSYHPNSRALIMSFNFALKAYLPLNSFIKRLVKGNIKAQKPSVDKFQQTCIRHWPTQPTLEYSTNLETKRHDMNLMEFSESVK